MAQQAGFGTPGLSSLYSVPQDPGEQPTCHGSKKWALLAFLIAGVAGGILLGLGGGTHWFGTVDKMGFIGSLAGGGVITAVAAGGLLWLAISSCKNTSSSQDLREKNESFLTPEQPPSQMPEPTDQKENEPKASEPTNSISASRVTPSPGFTLLDYPTFKNTTDLNAGIYEFYENQEVRRAIVIGEVTDETKVGASSNVMVVYIDKSQRATLTYGGIALYNGKGGTTMIGLINHEYALQYGLIIEKNRIQSETSGQKFVTACFPQGPFQNHIDYPDELWAFAKDLEMLP